MEAAPASTTSRPASVVRARGQRDLVLLPDVRAVDVDGAGRDGRPCRVLDGQGQGLRRGGPHPDARVVGRAVLDRDAASCSSRCAAPSPAAAATRTARLRLVALSRPASSTTVTVVPAPLRSSDVPRGQAGEAAVVGGVELERAVAHQLGVQAAVGGVVDVLVEDPVQPVGDLGVGPVAVDLDGRALAQRERLEHEARRRHPGRPGRARRRRCPRPATPSARREVQLAAAGLGEPERGRLVAPARGGRRAVRRRTGHRRRASDRRRPRSPPARTRRPAAAPRRRSRRPRPSSGTGRVPGARSVNGPSGTTSSPGEATSATSSNTAGNVVPSCAPSA